MKIYFFLIFSCLFFGCSESNVEINEIQPTVVFDFKDDVDVPSVRLSVFVKLSSDVRRVDFLRVVNEESGYEWYSDNLNEYTASGTQGVGFSYFLPPKNEFLPQGKYTAFFADKTEKESTCAFDISYDESLLKRRSVDFPLKNEPSFTEKVAVYAQDGDLVYYGKRKNNWTSEQAVWNEIEDASSMRICYLNQNETVMCMMPPVLKNIEVQN